MIDRKQAAAGESAEEYSTAQAAQLARPPAQTIAPDVPLPREQARARIEQCGRVLQADLIDPMDAEWLAMDVSERSFWLQMSRLNCVYAPQLWSMLPVDVRDRIKNNLYRAAERANKILSSCKRTAS